MTTRGILKSPSKRSGFCPAIRKALLIANDHRREYQDEIRLWPLGISVFGQDFEKFGKESFEVNPKDSIRFRGSLDFGCRNSGCDSLFIQVLEAGYAVRRRSRADRDQNFCLLPQSRFSHRFFCFRRKFPLVVNTEYLAVRQLLFWIKGASTVQDPVSGEEAALCC
jgi:hypothetical protein